VDLCPEAEIHFCRYFQDNESENDVGATSIGPPKRNARLDFCSVGTISMKHVSLKDVINEILTPYCTKHTLSVREVCLSAF
jgi:hypothetical protein